MNMTHKNKSRFLPAILFLVVIVLLAVVLVPRFLSQSIVVQPLQTSAKDKEIAALVGGKVEGNPDATVSKLAKIEEGVEGSLSFLSNPAFSMPEAT